MTAWLTLFRREVWRFLKVSVQTLLAPVVSTLLYLLIFKHVLEAHVQVYPGIGYTAFLLPGLVMMAMLQNAFANSSSSLIQAKLTGNLVFILLPPFAYWEFFLAFVAAAIVRGLAVGLGVWVGGLVFAPLWPVHPLWIFGFAVTGCAFLGALGLMASVWAESYDHLAAFQNFVIVPLTFLAGVFYSLHSLPLFWQQVSRWNPFFYLVDGFRYGCFGVSDVAPGESLLIVGASLLAVSLATLAMLRCGYKLRQ